MILPGKFTSTVALVVGNLLPIAGVLLWDWDVRSILTLYWSENLILGGFMLLKMFHIGRLRALGNMLFFLVHYGAFCGAHGLFISEFFAPANPQELGSVYPQLGPFSAFVEPVATIFAEAGNLWWWAFIALTASHLVSFLLNWLGQREYRLETMGTLMSAPYRRIMILHISVLLGGVAVAELGSPVYLVIVLVLVKIFVDTVMHQREHRAPGRAFDAARDAGVIMAGDKVAGNNR